MIRRECHVFWTAVMFYTRLPVPARVGYSDQLLHASTRYLTLVGGLVGGIGAIVFWVAQLMLPVPVSVALSMGATVLATGAFHEDAFSDFCDGFGGGYSPGRIMEIMKDSRIGTYGAVGLVLMLLTKFMCLGSLTTGAIPLALVGAHAVSRMLPVCFIFTSTYVRTDTTSKSKPIARGGSVLTFVVATLFAGAALTVFGWFVAGVILVLNTGLFVVFKWYVVKKIGGYTGDVLGALQQLAELVCYVGMVACQHMGV